MIDLKEFPLEIEEKIVSFRRDIHQHPELSNCEQRTAQQIFNYLKDNGYDPTIEIGGHGLYLDIGEGEKRIALRADMDALPIQEETNLPFSSKHDGVMHACGHDAHTAMLIGAFELFKRFGFPEHPLRLIWQPSEEHGTGAKAMMSDDVLKGVEYIFGGHVDRHFLPGELGISSGCVNASADMFKIHISGKQAHGARPHEAVDAIVVGSLLVTAIQTIVSREVDPAHPSVISVGMFESGDACNVISGKAKLEGTIRAQTTEVRDHLRSSLKRVCNAIGDLHNANIEFELIPVTPPLHNTKEMTQLAREAGIMTLNDPEKVKKLKTANMGGEDFAYYLEKVKGCYIRFGTQVQGLESHPAHSSRFDVDESALKVGALWYFNMAHLTAKKIKEGAL